MPDLREVSSSKARTLRLARPRWSASRRRARISSSTLIPNYGLGKWYVAGNQLGQAIGNGPDGIPDWGLFDLTVPNSSSGNQYNGRVDYTKGNNQFFVSTYIVDLITSTADKGRSTI